MKKNHNLLPGLMLSIGLALPSWYFGSLYRLVGGPVIAILAGMMVSTLVPIGAASVPGLRFVSKKILQLAIVLIGFGMNLSMLAETGVQSVGLTAAVLSVAFLTAYALKKPLQTETNTTILIGVGTAICGGSAIAATAPVIRAEDREIASAISTIFLFNVVAVILFPPLGRWLGMTDITFGLWAGTAINDTSSVVAAGQIWSQEALQQATMVKLFRTLMMIPVVLTLGIWQTRVRSEGEPEALWKSIGQVFPYFILFFIGASFLNTIGILPVRGVGWLTGAGRFFIVMAMAAIGLNTDVRRMISGGWRPIVLGLACWAAVVVTSLAAQKLLF